MDFKHPFVSSSIPSVILVFNLALSFTSAIWVGKNQIDLYDTANLRKDYLSRYCLASGTNSAIDQENLDHFLNCSRPGLVFENVSTSTMPDELFARNKTVFENWCSVWEAQRGCEKDNQKYVDKCFADNLSISVGFDLLTGFFESACKNKGQALPGLIIYLHILQDFCWYDERQILSCIDQTNLHYFRRNIKLILPCIQHQLSYCGNSRSNRLLSNEVLKNITKEIESGYISSRYVILISVDPSELKNETSPFLPVGMNKSQDYKCPNAMFAYIAFFVLLSLVLIALGALIFTYKVRSLNLPCLRTRNALVENDGNTVEL